ncbi:MAG: DUF1573 domain-containing protein [Bacteroidetes bacterium]|nr:DUF1573 domain-containing protein [Bacteroidota bacterium]
MRYATTSILLVILALMTGVTARAQSDAGESVNVQQCFSLVGTSDYYFGEIGLNETVEHTFVFQNNCSETVEIGSVRASCGCTAAMLSEKVIAPGGEAKIQVKFTPPRGSRGKVSKTVSLYMKDEQRPHTVIRFSAKILTNLDVQPQYIQLMGAEVGKAITGKATVRNTSDERITVEGIAINMTSYVDTAGNGQNVAIPLRSPVVTPTQMVLDPGQSGEINVSVTPEYKGQVNGAVRLHAGTEESMIQVFGVVREGAAKSFQRSESKSGTINLGGQR